MKRMSEMRGELGAAERQDGKSSRVGGLSRRVREGEATAGRGTSTHQPRGSPNGRQGSGEQQRPKCEAMGDGDPEAASTRAPSTDEENEK